jgi:hypothetical protein
MDISNLLGSLFDAAYDALKEDSSPENDNDCICLLIDESLGDCFSFCIKKDNAQYVWVRKQWRKRQDIEKVTNPLTQLQFIAQKLLPGISTQSGTTRLAEAVEIFACAQQYLDLDKDAVADSIQLDGTEYTLQICIDKKNAAYKWGQLPSQWAPLEKIVNRLLAINRMVA